MSQTTLVIDTSAIVAIYNKEADADSLWRQLNTGRNLFIPVSSYLECVIVLSRFNGSRRWLDDLLSEYDIAPFGSDERQGHLAADAFERYGRGSGHPARLNFGDCLVYAAAKAVDAPLLFKGTDFRATDVVAAL